MKIAPIKSTISFGELEKIDIRVGTIEKVEDIEKSDNLVKLTVIAVFPLSYSIR